MAKRLQKKSYAPLAGMIVLVSALIALLFFWTPETTAQTSQPSVESTTIVKEGAQAPNFTVEMFDGTKGEVSTEGTDNKAPVNDETANGGTKEDSGKDNLSFADKVIQNIKNIADVFFFNHHYHKTCNLI